MNELVDTFSGGFTVTTMDGEESGVRYTTRESALTRA